MTPPLTIIVPGEPNTDHRPRSGRGRVYTCPDHRAWKDRVTLVGRLAVKSWIREHGIPWPREVAYLVTVVSHTGKRRTPDADNSRGALDALQGVVWRSDARCRPVVYDIVRAEGEPMLWIHVQAYEPKVTRPRADWEWAL